MVIYNKIKRESYLLMNKKVVNTTSRVGFEVYLLRNIKIR
jgi:hypothetical protein